jgi:hypothetical protein
MRTIALLVASTAALLPVQVTLQAAEQPVYATTIYPFTLLRVPPVP